MRPVLAILCLAAASCMRPEALPPPPSGIQTIALLRPTNRTGGELPVQGGWGLDEVLGRPRLTAIDVLQAECARILRARGFTVHTEAGPDTPVLRLVVERWEPSPPPVAFVRVSIAASLVDEVTGHRRWEAARKRWLVDTRGQPSLAAANAEAARQVAATILAGWQAASP